MKNFVFFILFYIVAMIIFSYFIATYTHTTDFPCFYSAAKTIINHGINSDKIYTHSDDKKFYIPEEIEKWKRLDFNYSKFIALTMAPLGFLPYYLSKTTLIFLNISCYLFAIYLFLLTQFSSDKFPLYMFGLFFFYQPFFQNIRFAQVEGIIFLLLVLSYFFSTKAKFYKSGFFLGISILFKLFPIALAISVGLKNRIILITSLSVLTISFILPGSNMWLKTLPKSNTHRLLQSNEFFFYYLIFLFFIGALTAMYILFYENIKYEDIYAISISAIFITAPFLEYYHLTLLCFSYMYLFSNFRSINSLSKFFIIASFVLINSSIKLYPQKLVYTGILLCWVAIIIKDRSFFKDIKNRAYTMHKILFTHQ